MSGRRNVEMVGAERRMSRQLPACNKFSERHTSKERIVSSAAIVWRPAAAHLHSRNREQFATQTDDSRFAKTTLNQGRQIAGAWRVFLTRSRSSIEFPLPQFERWWPFIGQRVMTLSLNLTTLPFGGGRWFGTRRLPRRPMESAGHWRRADRQGRAVFQTQPSGMVRVRRRCHMGPFIKR